MPDDQPAKHASTDIPGESAPPADPQAEDDGPAGGARRPQGSDAQGVSKDRIVFVLAIVAFGILLGCLKFFFYEDPPLWQWPLFAVGTLLAAAAVFWRPRPGDGKHRKHREDRKDARPHHWVSTVGVGFGASLVLVGMLPLSASEADPGEAAADCGDPIELRVLLPEDGAGGFADAVADFNDSYRDPITDCRLSNVTAYAAPWRDIEKAFGLAWLPQPPDPGEDQGDATEDESPAPEAAEAHAGFDPLREVGPRPDFMIVESDTQIALAAEALAATDADGALTSGRPQPIGTTPLVLAAPEEAHELLEAAKNQDPDLSLPEMIDLLGDEGMPVLRTNPAVSHTGALFLEALYGPDPTADLDTSAMENRLSAWAASEGVPMPATNTDLLCSLLAPAPTDSQQDPEVVDTADTVTPVVDAAVLTTEAALSRYNAGADIGEACPINGGRTGLFPVYEGGMGALDYQAVGLDWDDDPRADDRAKVATALGEWLAGADEDEWHPTSIGIRDLGYRGNEIDSGVGFATDLTIDAEPLTTEGYRALQALYGENRVDTSLLVSIDHSMSMEAANGDTTRFALAAEAAATASDYLGDGDRMGLWTFPDPEDDSHTPLLDFGLHTGDTVAEALADSSAHYAVELHQMMIDGAEAVAADAATDAPAERFKAMVVLTDGVDEDDDPTVAAVHDALKGTQVALYVIAVGDVSCEAGLFEELSTDPRVTCLEAEPNQLTATFDRLYSGVWGIDD